eukprot:NODE_291_length_1010_cov_232.156285_g284_i0.p1 GENE.NODE_291_length_1010_cov_232.156285_g284_i0~~NODE_291_length_1010_cov_232.156285_g284_i0.p1  ORF type:complete len:207 (-),score=62.02 NODE_291_length_1010_cov_232.156285_g284_i0:141-761(-)
MLQVRKKQTFGKIGKRKAEKMKLKEEKRRNHEAMQENRRRRKEEEANQRIREKEAQLEREEQEEQEAEEERQAEMEKKSKEDELYAQLRMGMCVDEQGNEEDDEPENNQLLQDFVAEIEREKVVHYQDLAVKFDMTIDRVVECIEGLVASGSLNGVFDERGKFFLITMEELDHLATFMKQRGRVSVGELTRECNRSIRLQRLESEG